MEFIHFLMVNIMKEISKTIYMMVKVNIYGEIVVKNILANLKGEKLKEKGFIFMKMGRYLKVILLMDVKMEKDVSNFKMEKNILEIG